MAVRSQRTRVPVGHAQHAVRRQRRLWCAVHNTPHGCLRRLQQHLGSAGISVHAQMHAQRAVIATYQAPGARRAHGQTGGRRRVARLLQVQVLQSRVGQQREDVVVDALRRDDQHAQIEEQADVHYGAVQRGDVDQVQRTKGVAARGTALHQVVEQMVGVVALEHQVDEAQRVQLGEIAHQPLERGEELTCGVGGMAGVVCAGQFNNNIYRYSFLYCAYLCLS